MPTTTQHCRPERCQNVLLLLFVLSKKGESDTEVGVQAGQSPGLQSEWVEGRTGCTKRSLTSRWFQRRIDDHINSTISAQNTNLTTHSLLPFPLSINSCRYIKERDWGLAGFTCSCSEYLSAMDTHDARLRGAAAGGGGSGGCVGSDGGGGGSDDGLPETAVTTEPQVLNWFVPPLCIITQVTTECHRTGKQYKGDIMAHDDDDDG